MMLKVNMKKLILVFTILVSFSLVGCLAQIRAENLATNLNDSAAVEHSPYRWVATDLGDGKSRVEQQLIGEVKPL